MEKSLEAEVVAAWARATRIVAFSVESALTAVGVTPAELEILRALSDKCSLGVGELAKIAVLTKSGASRAIKHMEEAGLVERRGSGTDRRAQEVSITPAGYDKFVEGSKAIQPVVNKYLYDNLSPRAMREVTHFLQDVAASAADECDKAEQL